MVRILRRRTKYFPRVIPFGICISSFFVFLVIGLYIYFFYKFPPFDNLDLSNTLKYYPKELILKKGSFLDQPEDKLQHFLKFTPHKKKNAIRIGTFGCSFTSGEEVNDTESYPRQLQKLFDKNFPNKNIEILNFGLPGDGFQEQFFLWEQYAEKYHLDYILYGPQGLYPGRDTSFRLIYNSIKDRNRFLPKARFIISNDSKIRLVYFKDNPVIPFWMILRYDRDVYHRLNNYFPFKYFEGSLFYYTKRTVDNESFFINQHLLKKIKDPYDKKILIINDNSKTFKSYRHLHDLYNINHIDLDRNAFYWMGHRHGSSLENELIANIYYNGLLGKDSFGFDIIQCFPFAITSPSFHQKKHNLDSVETIRITGGGKRLLNLIANHSRNFYLDSELEESDTFDIIKGTKNFLIFSSKHPITTTSFSNIIGLQIPISIKEGMKLFIQKKNKEKIGLGFVKKLDSNGYFFTFHEKYINIYPYNHNSSRIRFKLNNIPSNLKKKIQKITNEVDLFLGNYKLGILKPTPSFDFLRFLPLKGYDETFVMVGPRSNVRINDFHPVFSLYIQHEMKDKNIFKSMVSNVTCKKIRKNIGIHLPNFEPLNL